MTYHNEVNGMKMEIHYVAKIENGIIIAVNDFKFVDHIRKIKV